MSPYQRQTVVVWSLLAAGLGCGLALWGLFPIASLVGTYLGGGGIIALWLYLRRYNIEWPDVAGEQMRELERQRAEAAMNFKDNEIPHE